jgi:hypothetical protein
LPPPDDRQQCRHAIFGWFALGLLRYGDLAGLGLRVRHWWQRAVDWPDL